MMNTHLTENDILCYLNENMDESLTDKTIADVIGHVMNCATCRAALASYQTVQDGVELLVGMQASASAEEYERTVQS